MNSNKHLSTQFDAELNQISTLVMKMGGLVEQQMRRAADALFRLDATIAAEVTRVEPSVNTMEMEIDHQIISVIGRRQPAAQDLRMLMTFSKVTANLERIGDESNKIARMVQSIIDSNAPLSLPTSGLRMATDMASSMLRKALDALARLDTHAAVAVMRDDGLIDDEFNGFIRRLMTYMMEDPRTISPCLDLVFLAKAIERIGDHSKNVAELVIYMVEGKDVRHQTMDMVESVLG